MAASLLTLLSYLLNVQQNHFNLYKYDSPQLTA